MCCSYKLCAMHDGVVALHAERTSPVQYAQWEEGQKDFRRSRSVWERALDVSYTNPTTWLKYAEMEMRHRFINHARNVWDRAVSLLPRVDQLWCAEYPLNCPCRASHAVLDSRCL